MRFRALFAIVAVLAAACADPGITDPSNPSSTTTTEAPTTEAQLDELAAARSRWEATGPSDYTATAITASGELTLAVKEGEVVSLASASDQTVETVFDTIEGSIRDGATVEVEYHPELGYPVRLIIDLDGDGITDIELELSDVEAMPIVQSPDELDAARAQWEALGLDTYRYIIRFECNCILLGTYEVEIRGGMGYSARPLDDAAEQTDEKYGDLSPESMEDLFDDLEAWITSSENFASDGIVAFDARLDPELGYPRWAKIEATDLDDELLPDELTLVATIDLIGPIEPAAIDREQLTNAVAKWTDSSVTDYDYLVTVHCECPPESRGPFAISVRGGRTASGEGPAVRIEDAFDLIGNAIDTGVDVEVRYDESLGYPIDVIIDPEAVARDGGTAFTISDFVDRREGFLEGTVTAGPQCPVQQDPPDPVCADRPVEGAVIVITDMDAGTVTRVTTDELGFFSTALPPSIYLMEPQPVDSLLGTASPARVGVRGDTTTTTEFHYDTGVR